AKLPLDRRDAVICVAGDVQVLHPHAPGPGVDSVAAVPDVESVDAKRSMPDDADGGPGDVSGTRHATSAGSAAEHARARDAVSAQIERGALLEADRDRHAGATTNGAAIGVRAAGRRRPVGGRIEADRAGAGAGEIRTE